VEWQRAFRLAVFRQRRMAIFSQRSDLNSYLPDGVLNLRSYQAAQLGILAFPALQQIIPGGDAKLLAIPSLNSWSSQRL
jgi:hypothetical protein